MAFAGQVALVLGGASGIGLVTSQELLHAGANVTICDVSSAAGEASAKKFHSEFGVHRCIFVKADVRNDDELEAAFVETKKNFKKLDILVNSAGILNDFNWNLEVDVNMKGVLRGTLLAWKHMGKQEGGAGGTVVNIASIAGLMHIAGAPVYTATKHAVVGWGRACGTNFHLERTGVRVMTMCPGVTDTPLIAPTGKQQHLTPDAEKEFERELNSLPLQKAETVAHAIVYLIQHGTSGSVWVSEGGEDPYEVAIPERQDMRLTQ